jgi:hypothetical protein
MAARAALTAPRMREGCANEEIAQGLSCSVRTVIPKINRIHLEWEEGDREETGNLEKYTR